MKQLVARSKGKIGIQDVFLANEALTAAYSGHLREAVELSRQAQALAQSAEQKEEAASYVASDALVEALFGNADEAKRRAAKTLGLSTGRDNEYTAALGLGFTGDTIQVQKLADDLAKRFPEDTVVQFNYLPTLRAQLALNGNDSGKAIEALQPAAPYELASPASPFLSSPTLIPSISAERPIWRRVRAIKLRQSFRRCWIIAGSYLTNPLAHSRILVSLAPTCCRGDTAKARSAYQDFLTLWKDADSDIPVFVAAKSEYAKLK